MIGVFDSGFGGLTIMHALAEMPHRPDLVYLGDNARAPYGARPGKEIVEMTKQGAAFLFEQGCQLVVLGCNTAATIALRPLQQNWLPTFRAQFNHPINLLGIVVPTIEHATGTLWRAQDAHVTGDRFLEPAIPALASHQVIGLFATQRTVESRVYQIEIAKRRPDLGVLAQPCPELAGAIERGEERNLLREMIDEYVNAMCAQMDGRLPGRVILGCTHYPLVADLFAAALGPGVVIINQAQAVADSLASYLDYHIEYAQSPSAGRCRFTSTGFDRQALKLAESFWGSSIDFEMARLRAI